MKLAFRKQEEVDDALELPPTPFKDSKTGKETEKVITFRHVKKVVQVTDGETGKAIGKLWRSVDYQNGWHFEPAKEIQTQVELGYDMTLQEAKEMLQELGDLLLWSNQAIAF